MNKQPLSTLPVCLFHPNVLGKYMLEYHMPESQKMLSRGDFLMLQAAFGSKLCSASSACKDIPKEALQELGREEGRSKSCSHSLSKAKEPVPHPGC